MPAIVDGVDDVEQAEQVGTAPHDGLFADAQEKIIPRPKDILEFNVGIHLPQLEPIAEIVEVVGHVAGQFSARVVRPHRNGKLQRGFPQEAKPPVRTKTGDLIGQPR